MDNLSEFKIGGAEFKGWGRIGPGATNRPSEERGVVTPKRGEGGAVPRGTKPQGRGMRWRGWSFCSFWPSPRARPLSPKVRTGRMRH